MDLQLNGKVAIVGGASRGLGRACSEVLAEEGARVAMCARNPGPLEQAADEIRAATGADIFTYAGDLDNEETIAELVAHTASHFGQIDIMVNNSGGPPQAYAKDSTEELWQVSANRSLFFFARMTREALPHLRSQGGGRIINILASTVYTPIPQPCPFRGDPHGRHWIHEKPRRRPGEREHPDQQRFAQAASCPNA